MASADESISAVTAAMSKSDETDAAIASAASGVDELMSALEGAGVADRAAMSADAKSKLDDATAQLAEVKATLEAALGLLNGVKGLRDQAPNATIPPNRPTPLNAAPAHLREPVAKVGDALTAPASGNSDYRQELNDPDSSEKNKLLKLGRATTRKAEALANQFKDSAKSTHTGADGYTPDHGSGYENTTAMVGTASTPPPLGPDRVSHADMAGHSVEGLIMVGAVTLTGIGKLMKNHKRRA